MQLTKLTALSPLDGRYADKIEELRPIFSEYGLMRTRLFVEIHWLKALAMEPTIQEITKFSSATEQFLDAIWQNFSEQDALQVKEIEKTTRHDLKAVEYFLKEKCSNLPELANTKEFIHFACTSDDTNNLVYGLMLKAAREDCLLPQITNSIEILRKLAHEYAAQPMLARTHGQPASPTTIGKEFANFVARLQQIAQKVSQTAIIGKCNGAVGNFSAHMIAYPEVNWRELTHQFVTSLGLQYTEYSTQIEPHDNIAELCNNLAQFNTVLIDLARDIWGYVSLGYLQQKANNLEVGSSVMPHKINPIDFENAEGNLGIANALLRHFSEKLPISRWQRDLSDSTVLRNLGAAFGYSLLAYKMLLQGLEKITVANEFLDKELMQHWEVLAEAIQTVMRRYGIEKPYEQLKALTRGKNVTKDLLHTFIKDSQLPDEVKEKLLQLSPVDYLGLAKELAEKI
ncbi:MAG: adenylosuccinate lyase [Gammaproteobacteria bacterium GWE2_37_16]|nr:MAG: adenylosuccinate lyase [Gammaproteobacteria bacterium GWE2_37_16]